MADTVAGARMIGACLGGNGLQVQMVVMILRAESRHIVIDVAYRQIGFHRSEPHRFIQQKRRCSRGVLCQRLIDTNPDLLASRELAVNKMLAKYLINKCFSQFHAP